MDAMARFILTAQNNTEMGFAKAQAGLKRLEDRVKAVNSVAGQMRTVMGAGGLVAGVVSLGRSVINAGDEIGDLAERTDIGVESIQSLRIVAGDAGVRIDRLVGMFNELKGKMVEAQVEGGEKLADAFARLGVSMEMLRAGNLEQVFEQISKSMAQGAKDATVIAAAHDLLGASTEKLAPVFRAAAGGMAELNAQFKGQGEIFSKEQIDRLSYANRQLEKWTNQGKILAVEVGDLLIDNVTNKSMMQAAAQKAGKRRALTPEEVDKEGIGLPRGPRAPRQKAIQYDGMLTALDQAGVEAAGQATVEVRSAEVQAMADMMERMLGELIKTTRQNQTLAVGP